MPPRAPRALTVDTYRSYGSGDRVWVRARVLEGEPQRRAHPSDSWSRNLRASWRRARSAEVVGARVAVRFAGSETEAVTDPDGHIHTWLVPAEPPPEHAAWHAAEVEVLAPAARAPAVRAAEVLIPSPAAAYGVISDIDDTIVRSHVGRLLRMTAEVVLGNAHTRAPFPGVAAFFQALHAGSAGPPNPVFYVSNGPWNLYDAFVHFLELRGIPAGPVELRDWGSLWSEARGRRKHGHKIGAIRRILATFPTLPFLLVGDSAERDPEIYRDVVREFPHRIPAVYVRDVSLDHTRDRAVQALAEEVTAAGSALVLAEDTVALARHAAEHGWIPPAAVDGVAADRAAAGKGAGEAVVVEGGAEHREKI